MDAFKRRDLHDKCPFDTYLAFALVMSAATAPAQSANFPLPPSGSDIVGHIQVVIPSPQNTLLDIARHFDLGYHEIVAANPGVSVWTPPTGARVVIPTQFILPPKPWTGIIIDIPQRRLYYFPEHHGREPDQVITFPIGISRPGWSTPLGKTRIIAKFRNPSWMVPQNILEEHRQEGEPRFPTYFPPGPDNPMGMLAMETGFSEIFIHATNRPWGVGMRTSHGCLHLYPEDAAELFQRVRVGTPVRIIDRPILVGIQDSRIYLSASEPVAEYPNGLNFPTRAVAALIAYSKQHEHTLSRDLIDWNRVQSVAKARQIMPVPVGVNAPTTASIVAAIAPQTYDYKPYDINANDATVPPPLAPTSLEKARSGMMLKIDSMLH